MIENSKAWYMDAMQHYCIQPDNYVLVKECTQLKLLTPHNLSQKRSSLCIAAKLNQGKTVCYIYKLDHVMYMLYMHFTHKILLFTLKSI